MIRAINSVSEYTKTAANWKRYSTIVFDIMAYEHLAVIVERGVTARFDNILVAAHTFNTDKHL